MPPDPLAVLIAQMRRALSAARWWLALLAALGLALWWRLLDIYR